MKKILYFVAVAATVAMFATSCKNQNGPDDPDSGEQVAGGVTLKVTDIAARSAVLNASTDDKDAYIYVYYCTKEVWDKYHTSDTAWMKEDWDYYRDEMEYTLDELVEYEVLAKGSVKETISNLQPTTEYVAYAYLVNKDLTPKSDEMAVVNFKTPEFVPTSNISFEASEDKNILTIKPSNKDELYALYYVDKETYEEDKPDVAYGLEEAAYYDAMYAAYGVESSFLEDMILKGDQTINLNEVLYAGDYVALLAGVKKIADGYEVTSNETKVTLSVTVEDGAEEYSDDDDSDWFAPARKSAVKVAAKNVQRFIRK